MDARPRVAAKQIDVETLFEEELFLGTSADHPLARKKVVTGTGVAGLLFVLLGEAHCLSDHVFHVLPTGVVPPVSVERITQLSVVQELVTPGTG